MKLFKNLCYALFICIATSVGLSSCSEDVSLDTPLNEGEVNVIMSASLPSNLTTYGVTSSEGGLKNLEGKDLAVRYVMEVYPKGSEDKVVRMINYVDITEGGSYRTTSFETRLLAAEYNFVFYADIVKKISQYPYGVEIENLTAPYYGNRYFFSNTKEVSSTDNIDEVLIRPTAGDTSEPGDLKTIIASRTTHSTFAHVTPEQYDIYTCSETVDLRKETSNSFTLTRPFAKLRLITTDVKELVSVPDWSKTVVTITPDESTPINNAYNALTGETSYTDKGYWLTSTQAVNSDVYDDEDEQSGEKTLYVFYLPVSSGSHNLSFEITAKSGSTTLVNNAVIEVASVPLVANKLTTIKGKLLTKKTISSISIDDEFEDSETIIEYGKEAADVETLMSSLTGSTETITYTGQVSKAEGLTLNFTTVSRSVSVYEEGNSAVLTLNISSIEEGAVITLIGDVNAPKTIVLSTGAKCSIRADLTNTLLSLKGSEYKYIVNNCLYSEVPQCSVEAFFIDEDNGADFTATNKNEVHRYYLNTDWTFKTGACKNYKRHGEDVCSFDATIASYLENNSSATAWDFVGNTNN